MTLLSDVTCADLLSESSPTAHPVIIDSKLSVAQATQILIQNGISSAPVYQREDHSFVGFFDSRTVNELILKVFLPGDFPSHSQSPSRSRSQSLSLLSPDTQLEHVLRHESLGNVPVLLAAEHARHNPFNPLHPDTPALQAVSALEHAHRLPLTDRSTGSFLGVISQSDIARWLYHQAPHHPPLAALLQQPLSSLHLDHKPVVTIPGKRPVLEALALMHEHNVSSIPLLDSHGEMLSVLALSDVKELFRTNDFYSLGRPAVEYSAQVRQRQALQHGGNDSIPYFAVSSHTSLQHTLGKMVATRAHRVFVTESPEKHKPIGVVALTDVLHVLRPLLK